MPLYCRPFGLLCSLMLACTMVTLDPHRLQADLLTSAERQAIIDTYDADLEAKR